MANTRTLLVALAGQNGCEQWRQSAGAVPAISRGSRIAGKMRAMIGIVERKPLSPLSFVGRLLVAPGMNITKSNTFAVSFLDHQYDWSSPYRAQIRQGLFDWLRTKVSTHVPETNYYCRSQSWRLSGPGLDQGV